MYSEAQAHFDGECITVAAEDHIGGCDVPITVEAAEQLLASLELALEAARR